MREKTNSQRAEALWRTSRQQFGLFNLNQVRAVGLSKDWLSRQIAGGTVTREVPRVFALAGAPQSWERQLMAACLWACDDVAVSGPPAAALYGLHGFPRRDVEISVVGAKLSPHPNIRVRRVDRILLPEIARVGPFPVTSPRRTLFDLAAYGDPHLESAVDGCLRRRLVTLGQLWLMLDDARMIGRRGVARIRGILIPRTRGRAPTDSELEVLGLRVLKRGRLPEPKTQYPIALSSEEIHIDLAYPEAMLAIELDSYAWHQDRESFEEDRMRDLAVGRLGWLVLRFTWAMLKFDPNFVIDTVRGHYYARLSA
jgi:very-short-patch-repair endonuclease